MLTKDQKAHIDHILNVSESQIAKYFDSASSSFDYIRKSSNGYTVYRKSNINAVKWTWKIQINFENKIMKMLPRQANKSKAKFKMKNINKGDSKLDCDNGNVVNIFKKRTTKVNSQNKKKLLTNTYNNYYFDN